MEFCFAKLLKTCGESLRLGASLTLPPLLGLRPKPRIYYSTASPCALLSWFLQPAAVSAASKNHANLPTKTFLNKSLIIKKLCFSSQIGVVFAKKEVSRHSLPQVAKTVPKGF